MCIRDSEKLLTEVCALFPDDRFHIGGDEAPKTEWKKCPHCKARMEALGLTDYEDLQGYFTKRVVAILKKHGKRAVCWNDVLESKDVDTENIIQYWTAQHEAPVPAFIERGGKVIFSNMSALYFDYPHGINSVSYTHLVNGEAEQIVTHDQQRQLMKLMLSLIHICSSSGRPAW